MFKDTASYDQAIKRIVFLQTLEREDRITAEDHYELRELMIAAEVFEDARDAEAQAEQDFMERFEEAFLASMER
jgi:hypothetical protein